VDGWRMPSSQTKRDRRAQVFGQDALALCRAAWAADTPVWIREIEAVGLLRQILVQTYYLHTDTRGRDVIKKRDADDEGVPPGQLRLASPYDPDARWAAKGEDLFWMGYKVHLTETCDTPAGAGVPAAPNLITSSALGRRMLTLRPRETHEALVRARAERKTETWKAKYALRAGVEGTINQALDITGMRRARYRGLPKVRLQHAFSATALNVIRLDAYWTGHDQHHPRRSRLEHLAYRLTA
jgi:hypothetical protein